MILTGENKIIVRRILMLLKPYKKKIALLLIFIIISSAVNMILPLLSKAIMDRGLLEENYQLIIKLVLASFLLISLEQGLGILESRSIAYINAMLKYTLAREAFNHLLKLQIQYFKNRNFAEIMNNIDTDVNNISKIADKSTFFIITQIFRIIGGIVGLLFISWQLTLVVIIFIIPIKYILIKYLVKKRQMMVESYIDSKRAYAAWYGDTIRGIQEIKLYGIERIKRGEFTKKQRNIVKINIQLDIIDKINNVSESLLLHIASNFLYILGSYMIFNFDLTIGSLFAFITYTVYITGPISGILNIGYKFTDMIPSAKRLFEFLDTECEDKNRRGNKNLIRHKNDIVKGNISFVDVTFFYESGQAVLKNVNLEICRGEIVAFIGNNGSGKTSIINLILQFYQPQSGKILFDGIDISKINLREYRKQIAVVSQNTYFFNATIKENINLFSTVPEFKVYAAAKKSGAHDFINKTEYKYESRIGNDGLNLSGGERQKIAVARALMKDSGILILDEATSNYDAYSQNQMFKTLKKFSTNKEKTIIIITHKPEMLKLVDRIFVIDNGCVVDTGNHQELYVRNVLYKNIIEKIHLTKSN